MPDSPRSPHPTDTSDTSDTSDVSQRPPLETVRVAGAAVLRVLPRRASRPPVLFVHGYFADATVFTEWLGFFAERGHPAYAVHLRGRGGTRPDTNLGAASIDDFTDDAAAVARELDRPAVVGHSMGGLIAQRLAERDLVRAAALIAPAPPRGISVLSPGLVVRQLKYLPAIIASRLVHPSARDLRALVLNHLAPAEQNAVLADLIPDSGRAGRDMSIIGVPVDARRVRCPVLVIVGGDDLFIPPRVVARVAARYGAPLHTLAGHGHMLIVEPGWRTAADLVVRWLADAGA